MQLTIYGKRQDGNINVRSLWIILFWILVRVIEDERKKSVLDYFIENQNRYIRYAATITKSYTEAKEVVAEVMFKLAFPTDAVYRMYSELYKVNDYWIYKMIFWTAISHMRKRKEETLEEKEWEVIASTFDLEESVVAADQVRLILDAMKMLPLKERLVIDLFWNGERTIAEGAAMMGYSPKAMKRRLDNARAMLRKVLEEEHIIIDWP